MGWGGTESLERYTLTCHFIRFTLLVPVWTHFAFRTALILHGINSTRCWKHSSENVVHAIAADLSAVHPWCKSPEFKKPVWDDLSFVTWYVILLKVAIRRWVHCGHKGVDMVSKQYLGRLWHLNNAQLALRGPKCAKNISSTPLHQQPLIQGRMDPCFHMFTPNSDPTIWMSQQKSRLFPIFYCPILVSPCEL